MNPDYFFNPAQREFLRKILYKNIAITVTQHSKMYFVENVKQIENIHVDSEK